MKKRLILPIKLLLFLCLASPLTLFAMSDITKEEGITTIGVSEQPDSPTKRETDKDVEVIGVLGEKPVAYFRKQMRLAELDFYDLFNDLADEDKYKIKCRKEKRIGSNLSRTVCYPQYVLDRFAQETQAALNSGRFFPTLKDIEALVKKEREASNTYAEKIINENPELLQKLIKLTKTQALYEQKKASR